jgi:hypothetical protein
MQSNRLQLKVDKTEVLSCATGRRQCQLSTVAMSIAGGPATPVSSVCDLVIFIDADLVMRMQINRTVSRCFAALRQLLQIRLSVSATNLQILVVTLVNAWLDYGNSVLISLPTFLTCRRPSEQHAAARLIFNLKCSDPTTDALNSLHWLVSHSAFATKSPC